MTQLHRTTYFFALLFTISSTINAMQMTQSHGNPNGASKLERLPDHVLENIFSNDDTDLANLSLTSKRLRYIVMQTLRRNWLSLKTRQLGILIHKMKSLESSLGETPKYKHFRELYKYLLMLTLQTIPTDKPEDTNISNLDTLLTKHNEENLIKTWPELAVGPGTHIARPPLLITFANNVSTPEEIRNWLNDPKNQPTIQEVVIFQPVCGCNKITDLPEEMSLFTNLKSIYLQYCSDLKVVNIPHTLVNLEKISLNGSKGFKTLNFPDTLTKLACLDLIDCKLKSINIPNLNKLTNLKVLGLASNELTIFKIPSTLTRLESLWLENNKLESISIPDQRVNLVYLNVIGNELKTAEIPSTLGKLQYLNLSFNQLESIQIPDGLTNLRELELEYNKLENLNIPSTLTNLEKLCTYGNKLTPETTIIPDQIRAQVMQ